MKAYFDDAGCLVVEAETGAEKLALRLWSDNFMKHNKQRPGLWANLLTITCPPQVPRGEEK